MANTDHSPPFLFTFFFSRVSQWSFCHLSTVNQAGETLHIIPDRYVPLIVSDTLNNLFNKACHGILIILLCTRWRAKCFSASFLQFYSFHWFHQGGYVFDGMLFVCSLVRFDRFRRTRNRWFNFGGDLDHCLDLGIFKRFFNTGDDGFGGGGGALFVLSYYKNFPTTTDTDRWSLTPSQVKQIS